MPSRSKSKKLDTLPPLMETPPDKSGVGYDYVARSEVDEDLLCKICEKPLVNPVVATCGHVFCEECIHENVYGEEGECPVCGVDLDKKDLQPVSGIVRNLLGKIPVYCPNKLYGCSFSGGRAMLPEHLETCERSPCPGRPDGCQMLTRPSLLPNHTENCQFVKVPCPYSGTMVPRQNLQRHIDSCPSAKRVRAQAEAKAEEERQAQMREKAKQMQAKIITEVGTELQLALSAKPVKINCGGVEFVTSLQTLGSQPVSFLGVLAARLEETKEDQTVFFDRDGRMFGHILSYLRTGHIPMGLQRSELFALLQEARYFRMGDLAARLAKTSFVGANMQNADLISCKLENVNFTNADLQHSDLSNSTLTDAILTGANMSYADLSHVNLRQVRVNNAKFAYANLNRASLPHDLRGVDFTGVDLEGRDFSEMIVTGANFSMAKLGNVLLPQDLTGVNFTGADLTGRDFSKSILKHVNFTGARLYDASLPGDLTNVNFSKVDFTNRDFGASNLTGASFCNAILTKANLFNVTGFFPGTLTFAELQIKRDHILEFNGFVAVTRITWNNKYADEDTAKTIAIQASDDEKTWDIVHQWNGEQTKDKQRERIRTPRLSRYWRLRVIATYGGKPAKTYLENFEFEGVRFSQNVNC